MTAPTDLAQRVRALLADEPSTREVSMFGGHAFMVNDKIVVSAQRAGELLVRVPEDRHEELRTRPGARQAVMGADRDMGPGWVTVDAASVTGEGLSTWLGIALEHNRAVTTRRPEGAAG